MGDNKCVKWLLTCLDLLLAFAQEVMKRISDNAYTHLAITSEPYFTSSSSAAQIMTLHASMTWMRITVLRPAKYFGSILFASAYGWGLHTLITLATTAFSPVLPSRILR